MRFTVFIILATLLITSGCISNGQLNTMYQQTDTLYNSLTHSRIILKTQVSSENEFHELSGASDSVRDYRSTDGKFQIGVSPPRINIGTSIDELGKELSYENIHGELIISREGDMLHDSTGNLLPDVFFYNTDYIGTTVRWKDSTSFILKAHPIRYRVPANTKGDLKDVVEKQQFIYRAFQLQYATVTDSLAVPSQ